eukprot:1304482-Prymnesium_polylepis.3
MGAASSTKRRLMNESCVQRIAHTSRSTTAKHRVRGKWPMMSSSADVPVVTGRNTSGVLATDLGMERNCSTAAATRGVSRGVSRWSLRAI